MNSYPNFRARENKIFFINSYLPPPPPQFFVNHKEQRQDAFPHTTAVALDLHREGVKTGHTLVSEGLVITQLSLATQRFASLPRTATYLKNTSVAACILKPLCANIFRMSQIEIKKKKGGRRYDTCKSKIFHATLSFTVMHSFSPWKTKALSYLLEARLRSIGVIRRHSVS